MTFTWNQSPVLIGFLGIINFLFLTGTQASNEEKNCICQKFSSRFGITKSNLYKPPNSQL